MSHAAYSVTSTMLFLRTSVETTEKKFLSEIITEELRGKLYLSQDFHNFTLFFNAFCRSYLPNPASHFGPPMPSVLKFRFKLFTATFMPLKRTS